MSIEVSGRALLFTSSPAEGSRVALEAAAELPEAFADEALGLRAFALMGVPFGAMHPREMAPVREWRGRPRGMRRLCRCL